MNPEQNILIAQRLHVAYSIYLGPKVPIWGLLLTLMYIAHGALG